jgi:hypothetical protein
MVNYRSRISKDAQQSLVVQLLAYWGLVVMLSTRPQYALPSRFEAIASIFTYPIPLKRQSVGRFCKLPGDVLSITPFKLPEVT